MASAKRTHDHDEIRRWVEARGGHPAVVKRTRDPKSGSAMLRIDFPGFSGEDTLEAVEWDEFFRIFDASGLDFLFQDEKDSRFNKLVAREEPTPA